MRQILFNYKAAGYLNETTDLRENDTSDWPHFYLFPYVIDAESFLKLGEWPSKDPQCVRAMAQRYIDTGYTTGWLDTLAYTMK